MAEQMASTSDSTDEPNFQPNDRKCHYHFLVRLQILHCVYAHTFKWLFRLAYFCYVAFFRLQRLFSFVAFVFLAIHTKFRLDTILLINGMMHRGWGRTVPRYNSNLFFLQVIHTLLACIQSIRKLPVIGINVRYHLYQLHYYDSYYLLRRQVRDIQLCKKGTGLANSVFMNVMDLNSISAQHLMGKTLWSWVVWFTHSLTHFTHPKFNHVSR